MIVVADPRTRIILESKSFDVNLENLPNTKADNIKTQSEVEQMLERSPLNSNLFIVVNNAHALKIISPKTKKFLTNMGALEIN